MWVRGVVSKVTPTAMLILFMAPGGSMAPSALSHKQPWESEGDPTPSA